MVDNFEKELKKIRFSSLALLFWGKMSVLRNVEIFEINYVISLPVSLDLIIAAMHPSILSGKCQACSGRKYLFVRAI